MNKKITATLIAISSFNFPSRSNCPGFRNQYLKLNWILCAKFFEKLSSCLAWTLLKILLKSRLLFRLATRHMKKLDRTLRVMNAVLMNCMLLHIVNLLYMQPFLIKKSKTVRLQKYIKGCKALKLLNPLSSERRTEFNWELTRC